MTAQVALHLFLRLLPSIILFLTGFLAGRDDRMRARWADLLFRMGNIRSAQREDEAIRDKIRLPFFILGGLFLLWPIWYLWRDSYAQRPIEAIPVPRAVVAPPRPGTAGTTGNSAPAAPNITPAPATAPANGAPPPLPPSTSVPPLNPSSPSVSSPAAPAAPAPAGGGGPVAVPPPRPAQ